MHTNSENRLFEIFIQKLNITMAAMQRQCEKNRTRSLQGNLCCQECRMKFLIKSRINTSVALDCDSLSGEATYMLLFYIHNNLLPIYLHLSSLENYVNPLDNLSDIEHISCNFQMDAVSSFCILPV